MDVEVGLAGQLEVGERADFTRRQFTVVFSGQMLVIFVPSSR